MGCVNEAEGGALSWCTNVHQLIMLSTVSSSQFGQLHLNKAEKNCKKI